MVVTKKLKLSFNRRLVNGTISFVSPFKEVGGLAELLRDISYSFSAVNCPISFRHQGHENTNISFLKH